METLHLAMICKKFAKSSHNKQTYVNLRYISLRHQIGGYKRIVNTDLSDVVINQQVVKFPDLTWKVMDALNLDYSENSFPVIIDKSLIDTLLCAKER